MYYSHTKDKLKKMISASLECLPISEGRYHNLQAPSFSNEVCVSEVNGHVESHQIFEGKDYNCQGDIESQRMSFGEAIQYCKQKVYAGFTYNTHQGRAYFKSEDGLRYPTCVSNAIFVSMAGKRAPGLK